MLFSSGIWAGANLIMLFERVRSWKRMPDRCYLEDFQRTVVLSKPFMTATGLLAVLSGSLFFFTSSGVDKLLTSIGVSLTGLILGASIFIDSPGHPSLYVIPRQAKWSYANHRTFWRRFQVTRTLAAIIAFACLCAAEDLTTTECIMIIFSGLWTGGVCFLAVERSRAWNRMALEKFLTDFRISVRFIDPIMPICFFVSTVAAIFFSYSSNGIGAVLGWLGIGIATAGAIISGIFSASTVLSMLRSDSKFTPTQIKRGRAIILICNIGRTVGAVLAFICLNSAIVVNSNVPVKSVEVRIP